MPKIAITIGGADSLECWCASRDRRQGDHDGVPGRGTSISNGNGVSKFDTGFPGGSGQTFTSATPFWASFDNLKNYDIVILS